MTNFPLPMRQIHLDFHTSPDILDVGADWDPDHFAKTLQQAHVNSVTIFATCHHGLSYYPSKVAPVHPGLSFDLLGEQIQALHRLGIRCPIYQTVVWNVSAAQRHPEWRQIGLEGKQIGAGPLEPGWPWLCVGANQDAYADEILVQTEEIIALYGSECDGFFYDIVMYHPDGCLCISCLRQLRDQGLDPSNPLHRRRNNHQTARRFLKRASDLIRSRLPEASIFFNSRWGMHFVDEQEFYTQVEIESLPTGGWGYGFYPLWSRYARHFGLPMLGMTGRFHRTWADWGGLKHPDALRFECGGILANGGAVSIGDQLHPRGQLSEAVYEVIGEAFADVQRVEPYCIDAQPVTNVAILVLNPNADKANQSTAGIVSSTSENVEGAAKILLENHIQFDVITDRTCPDFARYECLIVPDAAIGTPETIQRLKNFVANGGKLLLSHRVLLEDNVFALTEEMGVTFEEFATSAPDYFTLEAAALHGPVTRGKFPYSLYEGPTCRVRPSATTEVLGIASPSYFNRTGEHFCSHGFTPPVASQDTTNTYPAITRYGDVIYIYGPIFTAYQRHGNLTFRDIIRRCLDILLTRNPLKTTAPPATEVTVMYQTATKRHIVHLANYSPQRRATGHVEVLDSPIPLHQVEIHLQRSEPTTQVFLALTGESLPFTEDSGIVSVTIPRVGPYAALVFE